MSFLEVLGNYRKEFPLEEEEEVFAGIGSLLKEAERVNGILQILKNKNSGVHRILMRKNKTYETLMNHYITPDMYLYPNELIWSAEDFSTGTPTNTKMNIVFPKSTNWAAEFRQYFNEARYKNEQILTPNKTIKSYIEDLSKIKDIESADIEEYAKMFKFLIAEPSFFNLPLKHIYRLVKESNYVFTPDEASRFLFLTKSNNKSSITILLDVIDCGDLSPVDSLKLLSAFGNCPLLKPLISNINVISNAINAQEKELDDAKKELGDREIYFIGKCMLSIDNNEEGESFVSISYYNGYKMAFQFIGSEKARIEIRIDEYQHLDPNYESFTQDGHEYSIKFIPQDTKIIEEFRRVQYKAKYNVYQKNVN
ncbi:RanBP1 domain containing protein [Trichomonas vaginalis G3]|uniref:RanBP1 domain containing protein n=1 Tax=Trichomonas vaginalis (strain ATCC PRA-98 / G3) TaxID=412133 RepID=A2DZS5_TRIV3|nr:Ran GTPase binding [Trichomonas vaginalis G3]EAY14143.1 RanBP1 domain containing protein [Trichomonas vaginalis G3]KAI5525153.1 Ran GTPase binding [Trichomonas vaginalis G3]|eukprot:XP_001326366.1 RanBP1 domain containing protein [Trichomonas vaginalis G3]